MGVFWARLWKHDQNKDRIHKNTDERRWNGFFNWMQSTGTQSEPRGGYTEDDHRVDTEFGRRPYVGGTGGGGTGYSEQMRRTPDKAVFNLQLKKQSEFKKPYMEDDYQEMEYWYPFPDFDFNFGWPGFSWDDDANVVNKGWENVHTDFWPCPGDAHGMGVIYTCEKDYKYIPPIGWRFTTVTLKGPAADSGDCYIVNNKVSPNYFKVQCKPDTTGLRFPKFTICFHLDGVPSGDRTCTCETEVINGCTLCNCLSTASPTYDDDNTSDTIAPGGTGALTIQDGCPPFTWTTTDNGYTLTNEITDNRINTVSSASGVCGVDFDATCTVQVIDSCGSSTSTTLRNTDGSFGGAAVDSCVVAGGGQEGICIIGEYQYKTYWCTVCPGDTCAVACNACWGLDQCGTNCQDDVEDNPACVGSTTVCCLLSWYKYGWSC